MAAVLISTEFSCALRTLMDETEYGSGDRHGGRSHFLVFDTGTEFDRTAQAYFGLSPRRSGFGHHRPEPVGESIVFWAVAPVAHF